MNLRPAFLKYVQQRTGQSAKAISQESFEFKMNAGKTEDRLASTFETSGEFLKLYGDSYERIMDQEFGDRSYGVLYQGLEADRDAQEAPVDPSNPSKVVFGLRQLASEQMNFSVRETGVREVEDGIFWAPMHQSMAEIDDFAADSPARTRMKGQLFIDTTPGEEGGIAYLAPSVPLEPKLTQSQKLANNGRTSFDAGAVRDSVQSRLDKIVEADRIELDQPKGAKGVDDLYTFTSNGEPTAVLRIAKQDQQYGDTLIPGITQPESAGRVEFAVHTDQVNAEIIELNGEERKALLKTLTSRLNETPEVNTFEPSPQERRDFFNKGYLRKATTVLSTLVADGDLGYYEQLVSDMDMKESWLYKLKDGQEPRNAF